MRTVLRRPDFRLLFAGLVASMIGESILLLALAVWVKSLTGSNGLAGATIFAVVAPFALAPLGGWFVDRFRRRPFLIAANLTTAAVLLPLLLVRDRADLWIIYAVAVAYGLSYIAISASLTGLIKLVVPEDMLADANGALQTVKQGLRLVGPLIGAGLYTAVGGWAVALVGITGFVVAAVAVGALRVRESAPERSTSRWVAEVTAGVRHIYHEPGLRRMVAGVGLAVLVIGFSESLIFAYVDSGLQRSPGFVGVLSTLQGVGGLAGGLVAAKAVRRVSEVGSTAIGVLLFGLGCGTLAYPHLWLGLIGMAVAGFGLPIAIVGFSTLLQRRTPQQLMGRVSAAADALISGPQSVSIAVGAVLVSVIDFRLVFASMAVLLALVAGYLWAGRGGSVDAPVELPVEPDEALGTQTAAPVVVVPNS